MGLWKDIRKGWKDFLLRTSIRIGNELQPRNLLLWLTYGGGKEMEAVVGRCTLEDLSKIGNWRR
ncbi:hypothetical protein CK203_083385 [Vitis vinifera]|uniref:Uncharacterized protein n=1 Tax=Vitis vinifera TaxID=29760 RepID=A0A438BW07_VITVI|nr:hypothetical protein CK203_083385 [Vitis vinifera]